MGGSDAEEKLMTDRLKYALCLFALYVGGGAVGVGFGIAIVFAPALAVLAVVVAAFAALAYATACERFP